jgi:hypothetical protein
VGALRHETVSETLIPLRDWARRARITHQIETDGERMREWTAQRMDTLRTMWNEGKSSTQISEALGDVSRNAVMGKVDRMGLMRSALHNMRMAKTPMGACRSAMAGVGRGRLRPGGAGRRVEAEAVEPVAAFVVAELDAAVQVPVEIEIVPETIAPLDVIDSPPVVEVVAEPLVLMQEMAVPVQEEMVEKVEEALAPPVTERASARASDAVEEARAPSKPKRTAADLAKALKCCGWGGGGCHSSFICEPRSMTAAVRLSPQGPFLGGHISLVLQ